MRKKIALTLVLLAALAGVAYWQHKPMLAWYYVRQLTQVVDADHREACASKVATLDEEALPSLLEHLRDDDSIVCLNMTRGLYHLSKHWGVDDARTQKMVESIHADFRAFSPAGQENTLWFLTAMLQRESSRPLPAPLMKAVSVILIDAEQQSALRGSSLQLAAEFIDCVQPGQWADVCRDMAERGIADASPGPRAAAVQLMMRGPMRTDKELIAKAIPLLRDPAASVRRVALVALASENELIREDALLPLLHDEDLEVQDLCQSVLRKRGLSEDDLKLARLISDRNPAKRMRVLLHLHQLPNLNLAEWLQRLCHDPSSAVRAAAVRAAGDYPQVDLSDRLREMAQNDPCDAVRLNAGFYLRLCTTRTALE
jgi:hypothetical protein